MHVKRKFVVRNFCSSNIFDTQITKAVCLVRNPNRSHELVIWLVATQAGRDWPPQGYTGSFITPLIIGYAKPLDRVLPLTESRVCTHHHRRGHIPRSG
jgi:hypothetical protein